MLAQFTERDLIAQFPSPQDTSILFLFAAASIHNESTSDRSPRPLKRNRNGQHASYDLRYFPCAVVFVATNY